jgi:Polyketide cyclase / dehydrase and lipid transport
MAAFDRVPEWDPATQASALVGTERGLGAEFDVTTRFAGRTQKIRYRMSVYEPSTRFVLDAALPNGIALRDEITVVPDGPGSRVTYEARILPRGIWRLADPIFAIVFRRIGAHAIPGLQRFLR